MPPGEAVEREPGQRRSHLLAVVATLLVIAFLKWSAPATAPLGFAAFVVALAWPLQARLARRLPGWAALLVTVAVLLLVLALFVGAIWWGVQMALERAPQYSGRLQEAAGTVAAWAERHGLPRPDAGALFGAGGELVTRAAAALASGVSLVLLALALAVLGLHDVRGLKRKIEGGFDRPGRGDAVLDAARQIATKFQQYFGGRTVAATLEAVLAGLLLFLLGVDLAYVWGLMVFFLNYVPTVGAIVAIVPPSLFALVQFGPGRALVVVASLTALQMIVGNYVDPFIEGHFVSLSPLVVLVSIVVWGWVWGIPGALLGVPLTLGIMVATDHFPQTRWIARLLAAAPRERRS